jgi:hypothetical protein
MANRLQLKRGSGAPGTIFYEGEPVYDKSGKVLYVGNDSGTGTGAGSSIASADAYSSVLEILNKASSAASANIRLYEASDNGTNYVSVAASTLIGENYTLTLPNGTGSDGQVLKTDGSGNLAWVDQTSGFSGFSISDGSNSQTIASGNTVTFTGGAGIGITVSATDTVTASAELKENGGIVFEGSKLAIDLGASSITGTLANTDLANSSISVSDGTNSTATSLGGTITFNGTTNEVTVAESSGTITVGLPDDVTIGNDLTVTRDLTVSGNLNVVGTAVTFSVETTKVEDRVFELGLVNGAAPTSATTWDLGVAFNYFDSSAKRSALVWLNNQFVGIASDITETANPSASADPQITINGFGSLAAKDLYLGGTASSNQVINSSGAAVNLTFDGGTY